MRYELAKELKDAGFRHFGEGHWLHSSGGKTHDSEIAQDYSHKYAYVPLLEELIEACGKDFRGLEMGDWEPIRWYAKSKRNEDEIVEGETPIEAMAKLWLQINKKS